ncbi:MAG: hypothetical protein D6741_12660, partial [Planctomycetota bacterium]
MPKDAATCEPEKLHSKARREVLTVITATGRSPHRRQRLFFKLLLRKIDSRKQYAEAKVRASWRAICGTRLLRSEFARLDETSVYVFPCRRQATMRRMSSAVQT